MGAILWVALAIFGGMWLLERAPKTDSETLFHVIVWWVIAIITIAILSTMEI